jgi:hypothetical protein
MMPDAQNRTLLQVSCAQSREVFWRSVTFATLMNTTGSWSGSPISPRIELITTSVGVAVTHRGR